MFPSIALIKWRHVIHTIPSYEILQQVFRNNFLVITSKIFKRKEFHRKTNQIKEINTLLFDLKNLKEENKLSNSAQVLHGLIKGPNDSDVVSVLRKAKSQNCQSSARVTRQIQYRWSKNFSESLRQYSWDHSLFSTALPLQAQSSTPETYLILLLLFDQTTMQSS